MSEQTVSMAQNLYLDPNLLTPNEANERARPTESPAQREARVGRMAQSIAANGQQQPVLVIAVRDGDSPDFVRYEFVDGGSRVEAIAKLNEQNSGKGSEPLPVWCVEVQADDDLYKRALVGNLHREQNSVLDLASITQEVFDRNGWRGRGGAKKVAEYLGLSESRVSELQSIYHKASDKLRQLMRDGRVTNIEVALQLLAVPEDKQEEVLNRAVQFAAEEAEEKQQVKLVGKATSKGGKSSSADTGADDKPAGDAQSKPLAPAKNARVGTKHVRAAAAEAGVQVSRPSKRSNKDVVDFFEGYTEDGVYSPTVQAFAAYFVKWLKGEGTAETAWKKFEAMVLGGELKAKAATAPKKNKNGK
jgi:ParB-like chromosome segregation protein Spo0J